MDRSFYLSGVALVLMAVALGACANGASDGTPQALGVVEDASVATCFPVGPVGFGRHCPEGCEVIEGIVLDRDDPCALLTASTPRVIAGCRTALVTSAAAWCFQTPDLSITIGTANLYSELSEQGWEQCPTELIFRECPVPSN